MQIGTVRPLLTKQEKEKRRLGNLCLYCGQEGHFVKNCDKKPKRSWKSTPSKITSPGKEVGKTIQATDQHLTMNVSLSVEVGSTIVTVVKIDSGATGFFVIGSLLNTIIFL